MSEPDDSLWRRIRDFALDEPGAALTFTDRLAREQRWSPAFARRAVGEYRRFLYLAAAAGHPVTPSEEVDAVWHLHLTYTRSYWDGLCRDVLGQPLHHEPTRGGAEEQAKFRDWYGRTLASYRRHFGEAPPPDLWPAPERRFRLAGRRGIGSRWPRVGLIATGGLAIVVGVAGGVFGQTPGGGTVDWLGDISTWVGWLICAVAGVSLLVWLIRNGGGGGGAGCGGGISCGGGCGGCGGD